MTPQLGHDHLGSRPSAGFTTPQAEQAGHSGIGESLRLQTGPDHAGNVQRVDAESVVLLHQRSAYVMMGVVPQADSLMLITTPDGGQPLKNRRSHQAHAEQTTVVKIGHG